MSARTIASTIEIWRDSLKTNGVEGVLQTIVDDLLDATDDDQDHWVKTAHFFDSFHLDAATRKALVAATSSLLEPLPPKLQTLRDLARSLEDEVASHERQNPEAAHTSEERLSKLRQRDVLLEEVKQLRSQLAALPDDMESGDVGN